MPALLCDGGALLLTDRLEALCCNCCLHSLSLSALPFMPYTTDKSTGMYLVGCCLVMFQWLHFTFPALVLLPGDKHCLLLPSDKHCLLLPGDKHCLMLPGDKHCLLLPGEKHCLLLPGDKHCLLLLGDKHCLLLLGDKHCL